LTLYDGTFMAGAHSGVVVGTATSFSATIAEGVDNVTVPLVVNGAVSSFQLVVASQPAPLATSGASANGTATLNVYDHGTNLIVGGTSYLVSLGIRSRLPSRRRPRTTRSRSTAARRVRPAPLPHRAIALRSPRRPHRSAPV
jgi:hypothetical protein